MITYDIQQYLHSNITNTWFPEIDQSGLPEVTQKIAQDLPRRAPRGRPEVAQRSPRGHPEVAQRSPRDHPEVAMRSPRCCPQGGPEGPEVPEGQRLPSRSFRRLDDAQMLPRMLPLEFLDQFSIYVL